MNQVLNSMQERVQNRQKPLAVNPEEAFRLLGISRSTGYRMIENGTIKAIRLGQKRLIVPMAILEKLLEGCK